jgi:hypothetical protein
VAAIRGIIAVVTDLTASDILQLRLQNQHLAAQRLSDPAELVAHFGAVQSQDYPAARWALGQRLRQASDASIEQALADGRILRTHVLRPTWHFVAPADIRWMLKLTAPRVKATMASFTRGLGLSPEIVVRSTDVMVRALEGGGCLTRREIAHALARAGIEGLDGIALGHLLVHQELDGVICSGPSRGARNTYALLDERVPPTSEMDREQAVAELARRYFTSHGPATMRDFAWWSGLTTGDGNRGAELNDGKLLSEMVNGRGYWFAPSSLERANSDASYLLPNFDEYTVAYAQRDLFYDRDCGLPSLRPGDVPIGNVIVSDGRIVGAWKREKRQAGGTISTRWCSSARSARPRIGEPIERYARFLGMNLQLVEASNEVARR